MQSPVPFGGSLENQRASRQTSSSTTTTMDHGPPPPSPYQMFGYSNPPGAMYPVRHPLAINRITNLLDSPSITYRTLPTALSHSGLLAVHRLHGVSHVKHHIPPHQARSSLYLYIQPYVARALDERTLIPLAFADGFRRDIQ